LKKIVANRATQEVAGNRQTSKPTPQFSLKGKKNQVMSFRTNRRKFLGNSLGAGLGVTILPSITSAKSPNNNSARLDRDRRDGGHRETRANQGNSRRD
jgi:hypothetical protein